MTVRHILEATDVSPEDLRRIFGRARTFGKDFYPGAKRVHVGIIFFEPSTRTLVSFDSAAKRLGGSTAVTTDADIMSSHAKGETDADMLRVMGGYVDCIVVRHNKSGAIAEAVRQLGPRLRVPVINAGDGSNEHPTQAYLDLFTIWEEIEKGRLPKKKLNILFFGDNAYSRTVRSLAKLLVSHGPALGVEVGRMDFFGPEPFGDPPKDIVDAVEGTFLWSSPRKVPASFSDVDIVYVTRPQLERHPDVKAEIIPFTPDMASQMPEYGMILHPLPRNSELPKEVDLDPRARYFEQSDNGLRVRMALIQHLVNNGKLRP